MKIVVLGGYGNFGARICRALAMDAALSVIAAGRHPAAAPQDFSQLRILPAALDMTSRDFAGQLHALAPDIVIHCIGPFQGQDYRVAEAAMACGAHYIDLADGRDFVTDFGAAMNDIARSAGRLAVSGASTLPALSSAVIDSLAAGFSLIDSIDSVIAPGQHAPRGIATLTAVMSYAGRPFMVWEHSRWRKAFGWREVARVDLGMMPSRLSAACDVPDLALFPARYHGVANVRFRAALEVGVQHRALSLLAALRQYGLSLPIERMAPSMDRIAKVLDRFGSGNGCMTMTLRGLDHNARPLVMRWQVIAPNNHGPEIPCMPAILIARKLAQGAIAQVGALPCMGVLKLEDFQPEFERWGMSTAIEQLS
jgi:saccharopine dehydrogenase-like NADP-dependent oxidoreductase